MATITRHFSVSGAGFTAGLTTVGYTLIAGTGTSGTRVTAGVVETQPGVYGADVAYDSAFVGSLVWDAGTSPNYRATEDINPDTTVVTQAGPAVGPFGLSYLAAAGALNKQLGTYAALADAPSVLAWAAREIGAAVASVDSITDAELDALPPTRVNQFKDFAEYRGLEMILQNMDPESLNQIGLEPPSDTVLNLLERRAGRLYDALAKKYGFGLTAPSASSLDGGFASPETWTI